MANRAQIQSQKPLAGATMDECRTGRENRSGKWTGGSRLLEAEGGLELGGKFRDGIGNFGRLLAQGGHHPFGHLGFVADELRRGEYQGQVIIDVMPHRGKLLIQFLDLFDG
jgi:hypothetical protein